VFIPHANTGQLVRRHQTSYAVLVLIAVLFGVFLLGITSIVKASGTITDSGTVNIYATVPGMAPVTAPVITSPASGSVFDHIPIGVDGTCENGLIVKVTRNGVFSGSDMCTGGQFHISMDLFSGTNYIRAKHYNFLDQGGPVSNTVRVTYKRGGAPSPSPSASPSGVPSESPSPSVSPSYGPSSEPTEYLPQLILMSDTAYHGLFLGESLTWPVEIKDGTVPYAISWDWGDGTTDLISRPSAGTFNGTHGYTKAGQYKIKISASDSKGETAHLELVTVVHQGVGLAATSQPSSWLDKVLPIVWPIYAMICLIIVSFWLGEMREKRYLLDQLATGEVV